MISTPKALADFETCADTVSRICRPYRLEAPRWREFRGSVRNFTAAALNLTELRLGPSRMRRDATASAASSPPYFSLLVQVRGAARVVHERGEARLSTGDLILLDSTRPLAVESSDGTHQYALNFIDPCVVERLDEVRDDTCRPIEALPGPACVLADTLTSLVRNADHLHHVDLREHILALLLAALAQRPARRIPAAGGRPISVAAIVAFVDAHLHLAALNPQLIAGHFSVSLRQIYRATEAEGHAPAGLIWQRRLHRARQMLLGAEASSITHVAYQCGFKDSGHFSRAYRKAFGECPTASRHAATDRGKAAP